MKSPTGTTYKFNRYPEELPISDSLVRVTSWGKAVKKNIIFRSSGRGLSPDNYRHFCLFFLGDAKKVKSEIEQVCLRGNHLCELVQLLQ